MQPFYKATGVPGECAAISTTYDVHATAGVREPQEGTAESAVPPHPTRFRFRFMKSIMMYCPSVSVLVKYAFPRAISDTFFTNCTR